MNIPFSPPFIDDDVKNEVLSSLDSGWITTGPKVKMLEEETAKYADVQHVLCVNSATSGLMLALHWLGIGKGDEVIIPAYTYCATAFAVMHVGAKPVLVDVGEDFNINPEKVKEAISEKTKAIIPVDFAGWPCDYDAIYDVVRSVEVRKLFSPATDNQHALGRIAIVADAAHSFGANYKGRSSGSLADITVFSFHAVKNLTTAEGGAICLNLPSSFNNAEVYKTMRLLSLNGQTKDAFTKSQAGGWKYDIIYQGFKMNMPDVCAAIGLAQIRKYNSAVLKERRRVAEYYNSALQSESWAQLPILKNEASESSFHIFPLRVAGITEEQRDRIIEKISASMVSVNVHFIPLPLLTVFKKLEFSIDNFPVSYHNYSREISLPIYPQLDNMQCETIVKVVRTAVLEIIER